MCFVCNIYTLSYTSNAITLVQNNSEPTFIVLFILLYEVIQRKDGSIQFEFFLGCMRQPSNCHWDEWEC